VYARPIWREEIAGADGVSESDLSAIFHLEVGLTPWELLARLLAQQARALPTVTGHSVPNVAEQDGFDDPAYFSRVLSKRTRQSPQTYRKAARLRSTPP
jgi:two-component system response regulator YesN